MKVFKDDIVEIINSPGDGSMIGQRFKASQNSIDDVFVLARSFGLLNEIKPQTVYLMCSKDFSIHGSLIISSSECIIWKRPLKNRIKSLFWKFIKENHENIC